MTTSFVARIPTPVQYGYLEVHTEGQPGQPVEQVQAEFAEAVAYAEDYAQTLGGNGVTPQQAVSNLQQGGVVPQGNAGGGLPQVSGPPPWAAQNSQEQQQFQPPAQQQGWQPSVPQGQAQPQQGPSCNHGPRTRRTGTNTRGPWVAHFCPLPKGDPNQCKPIFD
jgi:hypothetical protein